MYMMQAFFNLTIQGSHLQGYDIFREIKILNPDVKAVAFSGHSLKLIVVNYKNYGFTARLENTVTIEQLNRMLEEICS